MIMYANCLLQIMPEILYPFPIILDTLPWKVNILKTEIIFLPWCTTIQEYNSQIIGTDIFHVFEGVNPIGSVMVSDLASSVMDHGFETRLAQTKDYNSKQLLTGSKDNSCFV